MFDGGFGPKAKLIHDHFRAFFALYAPLGSGPGKGAIDLVACEDVRVSGCKLSARGDTMHIQKSQNIVFVGNQILGSRMGAFFLAEYCKNATVAGNTVNGTNGSRVMSVEKSCADVTITGNEFRNGGRGSWINQPTNFVLSNNVFVNNTTKCERDPKRGRKTFVTGDYETYAELYFTLHQPDGKYGAVVVTGNVFASGPESGPAITFAPNGNGIIVRDNVMSGKGRRIVVDQSCKDVLVRDNLNAE
ncbi:MAG: NosD domain-containing protein [Planctomycetia bacterium]